MRENESLQKECAENFSQCCNLREELKSCHNLNETLDEMLADSEENAD